MDKRGTMPGPTTEPEDLPLPTYWRLQKRREVTAAWTGGAWRNTLKDCRQPPKPTPRPNHALTGAGLKLSWGRIQSGKRQAEVNGPGETMQLEWVADSAFRFFPAQRDELFGYVLYPVDLATNKSGSRCRPARTPRYRRPCDHP